jgi:hypothetical protein
MTGGDVARGVVVRPGEPAVSDSVLDDHLEANHNE